MEKVEIIRRRRKRTKTYKYLKVYFEWYGNEYFVEWREDYFTKKKSETWKIKMYTKRYYSEICKKREYIYENYEVSNVSETTKKLFYQAYEKYIFNIRHRKLTRICNTTE